MRLNALFGMLLFAVSLSATVSPSVSAQSAENAQTAATVEVQPGDTLTKIGDAHGTSYVRLFDANLDIEHPDVIYPGEQIRIPATDEDLASRSQPVVTQAQVPVAAPAPVEQPYVAQEVAPEAYVAPAPAPEVAPQVSSNAGVWDQLAQCESGGNWSINTGNGFYGGLQFTLSSWQAVGGSGLPSDASKAEQIARAEQLLAIQGWGAWPACTAKLGLR